MIQVKRQRKSETLIYSSLKINAEPQYRNRSESQRPQLFCLAHEQNCCEEVYSRARDWLAIYSRILSNLGIRWDEENSEEIIRRIKQELEKDKTEISDILKSYTLGWSSETVIQTAQSSAHEELNNEVALLRLGERQYLLSLQSQLSAPRYSPVLEHWSKARNFFENGPLDFKNASKEAISAVEALAKLVTNQPKATLGEAVKKLNPLIHPALGKAITAIWGYASDASGVRHGGTALSNVAEEDAGLILESCELLIKYLLSKDVQIR